MIDWVTAIVTGFAASLGSTVGSYIMTKHVIARIESHTNNTKSSFSKDLKRFLDYMTGGLGNEGGLF